MVSLQSTPTRTGVQEPQRLFGNLITVQNSKLSGAIGARVSGMPNGKRFFDDVISAIELHTRFRPLSPQDCHLGVRMIRAGYCTCRRPWTCQRLTPSVHGHLLALEIQLTAPAACYTPSTFRQPFATTLPSFRPIWSVGETLTVQVRALSTYPRPHPLWSNACDQPMLRTGPADLLPQLAPMAVKRHET